MKKIEYEKIQKEIENIRIKNLGGKLTKEELDSELFNISMLLFNLQDKLGK